MKIGILKEPQGEQRVALLPEAVKTLIKLKCEVIVEKDAGTGSRMSNSLYEEAGAKIASKEEVIRSSDLLIKISMPEKKELDLMTAGQVYLGVISPYTSTDLVRDMTSRGLTIFSMETIPRITRAQSMDILSSMATVSGYKAVIDAANHLPNFFPMFMTAAGTIKPAKVLVLGAGVAGLQAIATARKLGAVVEAFDVRLAVKEQVQSLGGKFIEVEGAREDASAGGYAVEQTEEFKKKQQELIHQHAITSDVIICTAQIPGKQAPVLIPKTTVDAMQPVAVIVDLAASTGGNCELTRNNEIVEYKQIKIIGKCNYPSDMPTHASKMFGNNILNFLKLMINPDGSFNLNFGDEIVKGTCVSHDKQIINEKVKELVK
jgi:NAD(P) transhydrogenase subunit alpha